MLELKNPHSVIATLERRPKDVVEISLAGEPSGAWDEVATMARQYRIPISSAPERGIRGRIGGKVERVGVAAAMVKPPPEVTLQAMYSDHAIDGKQVAGLWLALDCLQDPHNVGAIFRTAAFFGVRGIILTRERSAPITGTVCDVAAGGVESVPFVTVTNLARTMQQAKDAGMWVLGTSEHAKDNLYQYQADRPWLLVLGNEEKGARQGTLGSCDCTCAIKPQGKVTSLNVSVASGICISWLARPVGL